MKLVLLTILFLFTLAACGGTPSVDTPPEVVEDFPESVDESFVEEQTGETSGEADPSENLPDVDETTVEIPPEVFPNAISDLIKSYNDMLDVQDYMAFELGQVQTEEALHEWRENFQQLSEYVHLTSQIMAGITANAPEEFLDDYATLTNAFEKIYDAMLELMEVSATLPIPQSAINKFMASIAEANLLTPEV